MNEPFTKYKHAVENFNAHECNAYHSEALLKAENFTKNFSGESSDILCKINSSHKEQKEENRARLVMN